MLTPLAELLDTQRRHLDLDYRTLARRVGLDRSSISRILAGKQTPGAPRLRAFARVLHIPAAELLDAAAGERVLAPTTSSRTQEPHG